MCRKLIRLTFIVLPLLLVNGAPASTIEWTNGDAVNSSWCDADNWEGGDIPGDTDTAVIGPTEPNRGPIIGIGCNVDVEAIEGPNPKMYHTQVMDVNTGGIVNVGSWSWSDGSGTSIININGSPTITIEDDDWRASDSGTSILNIDGDPCIILEGDEAELRGADGSGSFYINMGGGYIDCYGIVIGDFGGGELNLSNGTISTEGAVDLGGLRGTAAVTVNMTGGLLRVGGKLRCPGCALRAGAVRINLEGGVIDCNELVHGGSDDEEPTYTEKAAIDANVAAGQITAYDGLGTVVVELDDGNTVVTALPPDPNLASNPDPNNDEEWVDPNVILRWTAGTNAAEHKIFFGKSFEDVNNMTDPCATKILGQEEYYPGPLEFLTTYYWRIDEVNDGPPAHPDSPWKGKVWNFKTKGSAIDPNLLVWYKLDESNGYIAHDYSGRGYDGAVDGNENYWDPCDGRYAGCRIFDIDGDHSTVIEVPTAVLTNIDKGITVSVWLKDAATEGNDDSWVFGTGAGSEKAPYLVQAAVPLGDDLNVLWRAGNDTNDTLKWDVDGRDLVLLEGWHHWAFIKDEGQAEMYIYFDGELGEEKPGTTDSLVYVQDTAFRIGAAAWSENYAYVGKMDDFTVYDYALSGTEIAGLFRGADLGLAWAPYPQNFAVGVPRDANLAWNPGDYAVQHKVFFGGSWEDVNSMTDPCATQDRGDESYDLPILDLDTTYYWRIDEVNGPCTWPGPVWRFTVADFLIIDDMESYDTSGELQDTWVDWRHQPLRTGANLYLGERPLYAVHGGTKTMRYGYTTGISWPELTYAEAWLPIPAEEKDWTREDVRILLLFFYGKAENDTDDTEQMYVGVEDTNGSRSGIAGSSPWRTSMTHAMPKCPTTSTWRTSTGSTSASATGGPFSQRGVQVKSSLMISG
jgi:hypothetical protein